MEQFYLMTFHSATHSMQTERLAKKQQFHVVVMPTPRELSQSCGLAVRIVAEDEQQIKMFFDSLSIPCSLYRMGACRVNGKLPLELVSERC